MAMRIEQALSGAPLSRRLFLAGTLTSAAVAPSILSAQSIFRANPFSLGIASGDPSSDGFVIWTRLAPDPLEAHGGMAMSVMPVAWEVASDPRFATIVARGEEPARPELAHSVHVEVAGLLPDRPYWYRFTAGGERSYAGRARTLPLAGASVGALKFGVAGCQNYEDGYYGAYRHLSREEDLAFVFHYGDYIYEYSGPAIRTSRDGSLYEPVRRHLGQELFDLGDYRLRYAQTKLDTDLQRAHAAHSYFMTFDDHEVVNNWVGLIDEDVTTLPEVFALRRAAAFQAWYEHMPVRKSLLPRGGAITAYREARYGTLASIDFLDTRQFRSDQPCGDGFKPMCPDVSASQASVIGAEEEAWLARNLQRNDTRWNCIAQQVMMMALDRRRRVEEPARILNMDSWAGYEVPRQRLLARMKGLDNVVVLTGDEHQNHAGVLRSGDDVVGAEFVITSISSGGDGSDLRPGSDQYLAFNPDLKFVNDQRGYATCEVTAEAWRTNFMVVDKVSSKDCSLTRRAVGEVAHGEPGLRMTT